MTKENKKKFRKYSIAKVVGENKWGLFHNKNGFTNLLAECENESEALQIFVDHIPILEMTTTSNILSEMLVIRSKSVSL